jgi:hypothetical protein
LPYNLSVEEVSRLSPKLVEVDVPEYAQPRPAFESRLSRIVLLALALVLVWISGTALFYFLIPFREAAFQLALTTAANLLGVTLAILIGFFLYFSQSLQTLSPLANRVLPTKGIVVLLASFLIVVGLDITLLAVAPSPSAGWSKGLLDSTLVLNLVAILALLPCAKMMFGAISVDGVLARLPDLVKKLADERIHREVIQCIEDLAHFSSSRRQFRNCKYAIQTLGAVGKNMPRHYQETIDGPMPVEHPLRELPRAIGRIAETFSLEGISDPIHQAAWVIRDTVRAYDQVGLASHLDVELGHSIERLNRACALNSDESTLYNFWANMSYVYCEWLDSQLITRTRLPLFVLDGVKASASIAEVKCLPLALHSMSEFLLRVSEKVASVPAKTSSLHGSIRFAVNLARKLVETIEHVERCSQRSKVDQYSGRFTTVTTATLLERARKIVNGA